MNHISSYVSAIMYQQVLAKNEKEKKIEISSVFSDSQIRLLAYRAFFVNISDDFGSSWRWKW